MSTTSKAGFTPEDKIFFKRIRDDILARPDYYRPGMDYLQRRWSAAMLYGNDLAERERVSEADSRWARQNANDFPGTSTGPEYERAYQHFMQPPVFSVADCLAHAFDDLSQEGLGTGDDDLLTPYDLDKAKAVLCLTWLLTDPQADQHELGAGFGKWGDDFEGQVTLKGRAMARPKVFDRHLAHKWRREWVRLAQQAWDVLPKAIADDVSVPIQARGGDGKHDAQHSSDFTEVDWFGTRYTFDDGQQAKAVGCLWAEFEKGELGLSEKTIGEAIGSSSNNYRLSQTFRVKTKEGKGAMHPAWETMIQKVATGVYRLVKPKISE